MPPRLPLAFRSRALVRSYSILPARLSVDGNQQLPASPRAEEIEGERDYPTIFHQDTVHGFTDDELKAIYRDLLRLDLPQKSKPLSVPDPSLVLSNLSQRILPRITKNTIHHDTPSTNTVDDLLDSLSTKLHSRLSRALSQPHSPFLSEGKPYSQLLNALQNGNVAAALPILGHASLSAPSVVMTIQEWSSLVEACLRELDFDAVFATLRIMKRSSIEPSKQLYDHVMSAMAEEGLFREIQAFNAEFLSHVPNHPHLSHLVTALTKNRHYDAAVALLHRVENSLSSSQPTPPPMEVYEALITALLRSPKPGNAARVGQAWDIFYHMRYLAHPVPSVSLYAKMIAACASSPSSTTASAPIVPSSLQTPDTSFTLPPNPGVDTLRGLDLWYEMTIDHRLTPNQDAYDALIHLMARSKSTAREAYRYAQEMLDLGRDADGRPQLPLTENTFDSLSEAAKKIGDVKMARWVLIKLSKLKTETDDRKGITHKVMKNIFYTYATYQAPFKRDMAASVKPQQSPEVCEPNETPQANPTSPMSGPLAQQVTEKDEPLLPQTGQAVLAEVDNLFELLLEEKRPVPVTETPSSTAATLFEAVDVSHLPDIALAYLSVYFSHSPELVRVVAKVQETKRRLLEIQEEYESLTGESVYGTLDLMKNPEFLRTCLFHCGKSKKEPTEEIKAFVEECWDAWRALEGPDGLWGEHTFGDRSKSSKEGAEEISSGAKLKGRVIYDRKWLDSGPSTPAERRGVFRVSVRAPSVAKSWANYIHFKVRCGEIDQALNVVREFQRIYPPSSARTNLHPAMPVDSLVALHGPRTLVRVTPRSLVDDDSVPPIFVFTDVAILHNHLVQKQKVKEVAYLTWLLHAYAGAVRDRRGMNLLVGDVRDGSKACPVEESTMREEEEIKVKQKFAKKRRTGRLRMSLSRRI